MKAVGIGLAVVAYTVGTWGYLLVKGYNVTLREWVTPLHPYSGPWPPKCVPPGFIFPTSSAPGVDCKAKGAATGSSDPNIERAQRAMREAHRQPGVPGRL